MQTGKEKTSNKKILTLATVLLVVLLQPAVATVTVTGTLSSNESASGSVYAGIVDMNANPIDWSNTVESSWVGNFTFPANFTSFQVEFFNVNVGYEYYLIVFVDQDSNGYPDAYEIGAIHGPFYLSSNNFNVGDIPLFTGGASGGGGGTGGMIEGTVGSGESTYGTAIVGLFDIPDPSNWSDRIAERHLGSQSFPNYGIWFDFQEDFIFDSEYVVAAFIDENGDQQPDAMEAIGMASVTVTGGYGNTGDINMSYGGGGGGGPTYIEVTSPDYMSNWSAGTGEYIDWNSTSDGDYAVEIELYKGGSYYEEIEGGYQSSSFGGNFWWSIPGYLEDGNDYQIRVYHVDSGVGDYSDYFQISGGGGGGPTYIEVTSPDYMSNWSAGTG
ncbi:MAG: Ser-Thr-rich GPI-anchored membrane family protein, partial [Candidatus Marinimicrobia bacterium]|nr:Ser-Thr-rich GPI-anchored membrane family protein [Candidatus Neomarinimicrobiota bacterium]